LLKGQYEFFRTPVPAQNRPRRLSRRRGIFLGTLPSRSLDSFSENLLRGPTFLDGLFRFPHTSFSRVEARQFFLRSGSSPVQPGKFLFRFQHPARSFPVFLLPPPLSDGRHPGCSSWTGWAEGCQTHRPISFCVKTSLNPSPPVLSFYDRMSHPFSSPCLRLPRFLNF